MPLGSKTVAHHYQRPGSGDGIWKMPVTAERYPIDVKLTALHYSGSTAPTLSKRTRLNCADYTTSLQRLLDDARLRQQTGKVLIELAMGGDG
jgi:hypothetical protein